MLCRCAGFTPNIVNAIQVWCCSMAAALPPARATAAMRAGFVLASPIPHSNISWQSFVACTAAACERVALSAPTVSPHPTLLPPPFVPWQGSITASLVDYAAAFWLLGIAGLSLVACVLLHAHSPRLNKPFVGHLE